MQASMSVSASSMSAASFGTFGRSWSGAAPLLAGAVGVVLREGGGDARMVLWSGSTGPEQGGARA